MNLIDAVLKFYYAVRSTNDCFNIGKFAVEVGSVNFSTRKSEGFGLTPR